MLAQKVMNLMPSKLIIEKQQALGLKVLAHDGAIFCHSCKKVILRGDCDHNLKKFEDISGSKFRESIIKKKLFDFADPKMQNYLFESNVEIFENEKMSLQLVHIKKYVIENFSKKTNLISP